MEDILRSVGESVARIESAEKLTGRARYVNDIHFPGLLHAALVTSPHAHARIVSIDTSKARNAAGVLAVATGEDFPWNLGIYLGDKPPLARGIVRHFYEPVAAVVAESEAAAARGAALVDVKYEPMQPVLSPKDALKPGAPIIHEDMASYRHIPAIMPEPGTNVANRTKIRKGDVERAFREADAVVEVDVSFPPGDHGAMEPRGSIAEIRPDGSVVIISSTQAPFVVRALLSISFGIPIGKIAVIAPYLGGGFGGKAGIQLEGLAYLLSKSAGGRPVKLVNTREEDMASSPGHIGLDATVKIAATKDGQMLGMDLLFLFDSGGYADYAVNISRAAAISCTGPYKVDNVRCDSLCVYTNHPFATAYRGFGHIELATAVERALDVL
ncbi:MAG TPA: molybdopterin-dependent oxidoreductase, partial [Thermosynergistes sp.]|nr:molybdopterin-dependent oxidoreductase [Thermosynergistes sp.]